MHTSSKATEPFVFVYAQRWHTDASGGMWGDGGVKKRRRLIRAVTGRRNAVNRLDRVVAVIVSVLVQRSLSDAFPSQNKQVVYRRNAQWTANTQLLRFVPCHEGTGV